MKIVCINKNAQHTLVIPVINIIKSDKIQATAIQFLTAEVLLKAFFRGRFVDLEVVV